MRNFNVARSPDSDADRVIESRRVEIKFSTLWESGFYKFQQLRDQRYHLAICLGVSPFDAHCWVIDKAEVMARWQARDGIRPQHGGNKGSDTAWLAVYPEAVPPWLAKCGGTLGAAIPVLARHTGLRL